MDAANLTTKFNRSALWRTVFLIVSLSLAPAAIALTIVLYIPAVYFWCYENNHLLSRIAIIGFVASLLIVGPIIDVRSRSRAARTQQPSFSSGIASWCTTIGLATLFVSQGIASNLVAARMDEEIHKRLPKPREFYENHDLTQLVGQSLRMLILRHRDQTSGGKLEEQSLEALARHAPDAWLSLATSDDPERKRRVEALTEPNLTRFVRDRRATALDREQWSTILSDWARDAGVALTETTREALADEIATDFGISLREALKHDFVNGGKAAQALWLDIHAILLQRALETPDLADGETRDAIAALDAGIVAARAASESLRLDLSHHTAGVLRRLTQLQQSLQTVLEDIAAITRETRDLTVDANAKLDRLLEPREKPVHDQDLLKLRGTHIVDLARAALSSHNPHRAALLLRELPEFLADTTATQLVSDILSEHSAVVLRHATAQGDHRDGTLLEPAIARVETEVPPGPVSVSSPGDRYEAWFEDGSERQWNGRYTSILSIEDNVALLCEDGTLVAWFSADRGAPRKISSEKDEVTAYGFFVGAQQIVMGCADGRAVVRSPVTGVPDRVWHAPSGVRDLWPISDTPLLVIVYYGAQAVLWNVNDARAPIPIEATVVEGHEGRIDSRAATRSGGRFMREREVQAWLAPANRRLLTCRRSDYLGSRQLWVDDASPDLNFVRQSGRVTDVTEGKSRRAVTVDEGRRAVLWNFDRDDSPSTLLERPEGDLSNAWFSADEKHVFVSSKRGLLWTFVGSGKEAVCLDGHTAEVVAAVVSPDERWVMTTAKDSTARTWSLARRGEMLASRDMEAVYEDLQLSGAGTRATGVILEASDKSRRKRVGVWASDLGSPALHVRTTLLDRWVLWRGRPSLALDAAGRRLTIKFEGTVESWVVDWKLLQDRLWELEPLQPSFDERRFLLGFDPLVTDYPKER
jgi:hypothetical protein